MRSSINRQVATLIFLLVIVFLLSSAGSADNFTKNEIVVIHPVSNTFRYVYFVDSGLECWQTLLRKDVVKGKEILVWKNDTLNASIKEIYLEEVTREN